MSVESSSESGVGPVGPRDRELWERARDLIPWRTQTNAKRRPDVLADVMPGFITRGEGCRIWDPDGRMFFDYDLSLGPIILGYNYPDVVEAVRQQLNHGALFPMASPLEIDVAERIRDLVPCAERVRFLKTGADANAACVRIARVVTGRDMIVITGYHGWSDVFAPGRPGVPDPVSALTIRCDFGDAEAVAAAFQRHPGRIAAVLTAPYDWGPAPSAEYLQSLHALAQEQEALLIFDEVLTGFRLARGGGQEYFGVTPHMAVLGKAFANGFPLAAYVGKASVMEEGLSRTVITTTYAGEALSLAAAGATLEVMKTQPVHHHIWDMGQKLMDGMKTLLLKHRIPADIHGLPPYFTVVFQTGDESRDQECQAAFQKNLIQRGVFFRGDWRVSYSHREEDIDDTLKIIDECLSG